MNKHTIQTDYGQNYEMSEFRLPTTREMQQIIADSRNVAFRDSVLETDGASFLCQDGNDIYHVVSIKKGFSGYTDTVHDPSFTESLKGVSIVPVADFTSPETPENKGQMFARGLDGKTVSMHISGDLCAVYDSSTVTDIKRGLSLAGISRDNLDKLDNRLKDTLCSTTQGCVDALSQPLDIHIAHPAGHFNNVFKSIDVTGITLAHFEDIPKAKTYLQDGTGYDGYCVQQNLNGASWKLTAVKNARNTADAGVWLRLDVDGGAKGDMIHFRDRENGKEMLFTCDGDGHAYAHELLPRRKSAYPNHDDEMKAILSSTGASLTKANDAPLNGLSCLEVYKAVDTQNTYSDFITCHNEAKDFNNINIAYAMYLVASSGSVDIAKHPVSPMIESVHIADQNEFNALRKVMPSVAYINRMGCVDSAYSELSKNFEVSVLPAAVLPPDVYKEGNIIQISDKLPPMCCISDRLAVSTEFLPSQQMISMHPTKALNPLIDAIVDVELLRCNDAGKDVAGFKVYGSIDAYRETHADPSVCGEELSSPRQDKNVSSDLNL